MRLCLGLVSRDRTQGSHPSVFGSRGGGLLQIPRSELRDRDQAVRIITDSELAGDRSVGHSPDNPPRNIKIAAQRHITKIARSIGVPAASKGVTKLAMAQLIATAAGIDASRCRSVVEVSTLLRAAGRE